MTKARMPDTFEDAMMDIIRTLGDDQAAMLCGVSRQVARDYSDPDRDGRPVVHNALLMDIACFAQTGRAPFLEAYSRQLTLRTSTFPRQVETALIEALDLPTAVGRLIDIIRKSQSIESENDTRLSTNEAGAILTELKAQRRELDDVEAAVRRAMIQ